jgi:hypothetical protein
MRPHLRWLLTAILSALIVSSASAQLTPMMLPLLDEEVGAPLLLMSKGVQKEINLTEQQREKFAQILRDVHAKYQPDLRQAMTAGDRLKFLKTMRETSRESREKVDKAVPDILNAEQTRRLKQIEIQVNGVLSFDRPDVQKELKLTSKQKDEIKHIHDGLKKDTATVIQDAASAPLRKSAEAVRKVRDLRINATKKALDTLDDEQKKAWKDLTGDKFDFRLEIFNRPGVRTG